MNATRLYLAASLFAIFTYYGYWVVDEWMARASCEAQHGIFHSNPDEHICVRENAVIK